LAEPLALQCIANKSNILSTICLSLFQYFNKRYHFWAIENDIKTEIGDVVLIERLPEKLTPLVSHKIKEQVFKIGAVVDPVTNRRCRGKIFIDEEQRQLEEMQIQEEQAKRQAEGSRTPAAS
jgi:hypothetical protein